MAVVASISVSQNAPLGADPQHRWPAQHTPPRIPFCQSSPTLEVSRCMKGMGASLHEELSSSYSAKHSAYIISFNLLIRYV